MYIIATILNEEYDITQSTKSTQQQDNSTVFIRIMLNYMLEDDTGFKSQDNVSQGIEHYKLIPAIV